MKIRIWQSGTHQLKDLCRGTLFIVSGFDSVFLLLKKDVEHGHLEVFDLDENCFTSVDQNQMVTPVLIEKIHVKI